MKDTKICNLLTTVSLTLEYFVKSGEGSTLRIVCDSFSPETKYFNIFLYLNKTYSHTSDYTTSLETFHLY